MARGPFRGAPHGAGIALTVALLACGFAALAQAQPFGDGDRTVPHRRAPSVELHYERLSKTVDTDGRKSEQGGVFAETTPTDGDLAETIDVRLSPRVQALAEELGGDPTRIFAWVRRNVAFTPTFGSIQGSEGCLLSRECNAHDTASLLIALFRASGIPARYVLGSVSVDPAFLESALGDFTNQQRAIQYAADAGVPLTLLTDDSNVVEAVRLEHAWVEAYFPADGEGAPSWVTFEPALKRTRFTPPIDAATDIGLDRSAYEAVLTAAILDADGDSIVGVDTARIEGLVAELEANLEGFLGALPDGTTVGEILGQVEPRIRRSLFDPESLRLLPPETPATSLPDATYEVVERVSELSESARHRVEVRILDFALRLSVTLSLPELADRRLTLGYLPATQADADLIANAGGLFAVPPRDVQLRPQIYLDGELIGASEWTSEMGRKQDLELKFYEPGGNEHLVEHWLTVGSHSVIGVNLQRSDSEGLRGRLERIAATIESGQADGSAPLDDVLGELLYSQALIYYAFHDAHVRLSAHELDIVLARRPSELLMAFDPVFERDVLKRPTATRHGSMRMDFKHLVMSFASRSGNTEDEGSYSFGTGSFGSALEHFIFEATQQAASVSTMRLIYEANKQGIPVFAIDSRNAARVKPQLDFVLGSRAPLEIAEDLEEGRYVVVPRDPIQFGLWEGSGWIAIHPVNTSGGYWIFGEINGGATATDAINDYYAGATYEETTVVGRDGTLAHPVYDGKATMSVSNNGAELEVLRRNVEAAENAVRIINGTHRAWRPLAPCAREWLNTMRRSALFNGSLWGGLFASVPGITGFTDIRYHVPSLSAFVWEELAKKLAEQQRQEPLCQIEDDEPTE